MDNKAGDNEGGKEVQVSLPYEWCFKKLLGPTLDEVGSDVAGLYKKGRELIVDAAARKTKDLNDGKYANLRVARDVFWNGSFTDDAICAEYFGGILAASRTEDGRDDAAIYYVDTIKSMSSRQLHLHYVIYDALNSVLINDPSKAELNVGMSSDLNHESVWFLTFQLEACGLAPDTDLAALHTLGLIESYETNVCGVPGAENITYTHVRPTTLGVHLYAIAFNEFERWRDFPKYRFSRFEGIKLPTNIFSSKEKLDEAIRLTLEQSPKTSEILVEDAGQS